MSLRHAVLGLLSEGPASGYDLLQTFDASLEHVWPATQSQLYTELGKLATAKLIEVSAEGPRGRKEYALTEAGLAELRHWMIDVEPNQVLRSDQLLRVFFFGVLTPEQGRDYLLRQARVAAESHRELEKVRAGIEHHGDDPLAVYGRLSLEWGLRFNTMRQEWAEWAAEQVGRDHELGRVDPGEHDSENHEPGHEGDED